jgi:hypothetical protein
VQIKFRKVSKDPKDFCFSLGNLDVSGSFQKSSNSIVDIKFLIEGSIDHICDICADSFLLLVKQDGKISVTNQEYRGEKMDLLEIYNGNIDFKDIINSEVESYKSDYHYCKSCIENR